MKIGIIGAGAIGATLARKFVGAGHDVKIANSRGPETLASVALETGATAVTAHGAVKDVDVVVLSIPMKGVDHLPKGLFDGARGDVVIVDTINYYPKRDGSIEKLDLGELESRYVSERIGRPVVKAFNNMLSQVLVTEGKPAGSVDRIAMPVAGDDTKAKAIGRALVDIAGFDAIDAGTLDTSWRQQPGTPVYCTDYDEEGVRAALARADKASAPRNRDAVWEKFSHIPATTQPDAATALIREINRSTNEGAA